MAGLFLVFTLSILSIITSIRKLALVFWVVGLLLTLVMFSYHATDILKINW